MFIFSLRPVLAIAFLLSGATNALGALPVCAPVLLPPQNFADWLSQASPDALPLPRTRTDLSVLVLGVGPGGLVQIKKLQDRGIPVEAAERHSEFGGLWNSSNPLSPAYDSLRMDSSRATSHFGEPGDKKEWPDYFDRETALRFLNDYATRHQLAQKIRFNMEVTRIEKDPSGSWNTFFSDGSMRSYRAVVLAPGKYNRDNALVPDPLRAQADASGLHWLHSSNYRNPIQSGLQGQRVLVVGGSNSAVDIATELAETADTVWLSIRSTRWPVPPYVFGTPADEFASNGPKLPHNIEMFVFNLLQRMLVGHPRRFGFADPDHALLDKLPFPDRGILSAIKKGKIQLRSNIAAIDPDGTVRFATSARPDDESVNPTAIVFATGYKQRFPFLPQEFQNFESEGTLPLLSFHPTERGLFFLIEPTVPEGSWPMLAESAESYAAFLEAETLGLETNLAVFDSARLTNPMDLKGKFLKAADGTHVDPARFRKAHSDARAFFAGTPR